MSTPLLQVRDVSKRFPGVQALEKVCLQVQAGEILAVVGENGAGKSTLMKILAGIYPTDDGTILWEGRPVRPGSVAEALKLGISLIHQELNLADNLSVAANLFLGREYTWGGPLRLLNQRRMVREARALLDRVGLACDPLALVGDLPPGQQQLVEIAHALALSSRLLILDEPTSCLSQRETVVLFQVMNQLKKTGVAMVYISHRLGEVEIIADRVTVLRDGRNAGELERGQFTHDALVRLMVGREWQQFFHTTSGKGAAEGAPPRLEVSDLRYAGGPETPISFRLGRGEIVGLAGLVGAGRTELAEALFGIRRRLAGQVRLDGQAVRLESPRQAVAAGLILVPEDRRVHGLVLEDSVQHNVGLPNLDQLSRFRLVSRRREAALAQDVCRKLRVQTPGLDQTIGLLSGGNQQKIVLGKWLQRRPRVLLFDEPTRGIDVGAKSEIYALMHQLADAGVAILMISSDLEEILGMSDRVLVLCQGRLAGELPRERLSEEAIMILATGGVWRPAPNMPAPNMPAPNMGSL